jgi:hypothetical protein
MNNENSVPIADLFELNKRVSLNLWQMANERGKPSGLSPHVIYPFKRDRTVRISEQEARIICCGLLNNLSLYYSVETPTKQRYVQKGKKKEGTSAQTDLTMYGFDGQSFKRVINMEFKAHNCDKRDIAKDIEKLVREGIQGNWFHTLGNTDSGTMGKLFRKFESSFLGYSHIFCDIEISIVFCFCVLKKQKAYMRPFLYQPSKDRYEKYVTDFFDSSSSNLKDHWQVFEACELINIPGEPNDEHDGDITPEVPGDNPDRPDILKNFRMLWEDAPGFSFILGTKGGSAKYKKQPCLWVFPEYFEIAPKGKRNRQFKALCEIQRRYFSEIRGKATIYFNSSDFTSKKFEDFVIEAKKYVSTI